MELSKNEVIAQFGQELNNVMDCTTPRLTEYQVRRNQLEAMIDETSIAEVLEDLQTILEEKADHIESSYNDKASANVYRTMRRKLDPAINYWEKA